jgi:Protein of unknown function (DUF1203)
MQPYRVVAIGDRIAGIVRKTLQSPGYGHPAHSEVASGYGPCRQCLSTFNVGTDRRILFTYDPFHGKEHLPLPGPVYIHENDCERYPESAGFPVDMLSHRLTLNAYALGRRLVAQKYVSNGVIEPELEWLLRDREVAYIHVRDTDAGCYDFLIERTPESDELDQNTRSNGGTSHE